MRRVTDKEMGTNPERRSTYTPIPSKRYEIEIFCG
jgi:hypothetical protein